MTYIGEFEDGLRNGKGKFINPKHGYTKEGDWVKGRAHGDIVVTYKDKSKYVGLMERNKRHG